jgi:hypothetical protein
MRNTKGTLPDSFGGLIAGAGNYGVLTFPANIYGNSGISIPAATVDGLPVSLLVVGRHLDEPLLPDAALAFEHSHPRPLVSECGSDMQQPVSHYAAHWPKVIGE